MARVPRVPDKVCRFSFTEWKRRTPDALMTGWVRWKRRRTTVENDIANWMSNYATYKSIKKAGASYGSPKERRNAMRVYKTIADRLEKRIRATALSKCGTLKGLSSLRRRRRR